MNNYQQSLSGAQAQADLREVYESLSEETRAYVDARADAVARDIRKQGQPMSRQGAIELLFNIAAHTGRLDLIIPA